MTSWFDYLTDRSFRTFCYYYYFIFEPEVTIFGRVELVRTCHGSPALNITSIELEDTASAGSMSFMDVTTSRCFHSLRTKDVVAAG